MPDISDRIEKRVPALDGLRGLAILLVAPGHIFYSLYPFKFGWIGLNLFFVLSGYLITMRLFHHLKMDGRRYFLNFYARRVLRIFPLYYACLLVFFALLPLVYSRYFLYFSSVHEIQGWYWGYASNWYIFFFGLPKNPVFFHFWSLAVEEQFYLIWPLLFKYIVRFKYRLIVISLLLVMSVWSRNASTFDRAYYNTLTAFEPLMLGCIVAMLYESQMLKKSYSILQWMALAGIAVLGLILWHDSNLHITNDWLLRVGYSAIDLLWVWLLAFLLLDNQRPKFIGHFFKLKWIGWLGKYSYGIYIFHWIVLQLFIYKMEMIFRAQGLSLTLTYYSVRLFGIALILFASYCSYQIFELRFLRLKRWFP